MLRLVEDIRTFVARGRGTRNLCGIGKVVEENGRYRPLYYNPKGTLKPYNPNGKALAPSYQMLDNKRFNKVFARNGFKIDFFETRRKNRSSTKHVTNATYSKSNGRETLTVGLECHNSWDGGSPAIINLTVKLTDKNGEVILYRVKQLRLEHKQELNELNELIKFVLLLLHPIVVPIITSIRRLETQVSILKSELRSLIHFFDKFRMQQMVATGWHPVTTN